MRGLMLCAVALLSCRDEPTPVVPEPEYQVGALEGYVFGAGEPVDAEVRARAHEQFDKAAETRTDSTGWYRLELPAGRYFIQADPTVGWAAGVPADDVVQLEPRVMRHDIRMGRVKIRVPVPAILENRRLDVRLECATQECRRYIQYERIKSEILEFDFPVVHPGTYRIELNLAGASPFWFPGTTNEEDAELVEITDDVASTYELSLEGMASIAGSVTGSWQQLQSGPPVVAALSSDSTMVAFAQADSDGEFRVDLLAAQPVKLVVLARGVENWIGGSSFRSATVYSPAPGELVEAMPIVESGIRCRMTSGGFRTSYRTSFLVRDTFGNTYQPDVQFANPASIPNLPPGRYFLYVHGMCNGETWGSQWYNGASSVAQATPIDLAPGEVASITIALEEGARMTGSIASASGRPVGARVSVHDEHGTMLCGRSFGDGVISFAGLGDGDYYLASSFLNLTWWYPGTTNFDLAEPIRVRGRADVTGIDWRFPF